MVRGPWPNVTRPRAWRLLLLLLLLPSSAPAASAYPGTADRLASSSPATFRRSNGEDAASTPPAGKFAPRSWWRFEDPSHIGLDTMGNHDLHPATGKAPETVETPIQKASGGIVGGFIQLSPGADSNLSWSANASYLPVQPPFAARSVRRALF